MIVDILFKLYPIFVNVNSPFRNRELFIPPIDVTLWLCLASQALPLRWSWKVVLQCPSSYWT